MPPDPRRFQAAFHVHLLAPLENELLDLALLTIALVWERRMGQPQDFTVAVCDRAITPDGVAGNGHYDPATRRFTFALSMFIGTQGEVTDPEVRRGMIVRVAAHEAMHAV